MSYVKYRYEPSVIESVQGKYLELLVEAVKHNLDSDAFLDRFQSYFINEDKATHEFVSPLVDLTKESYWQLLELFKGIIPLSKVPFLFIDIPEDESPALEFCLNDEYDHAIHFDCLDKHSKLATFDNSELIVLNRPEPLYTKDWKTIDYNAPHIKQHTYGHLSSWKYNLDHLGSTSIFEAPCSSHALEYDVINFNQDLREGLDEFQVDHLMSKLNPIDRTCATVIDSFYLCIFKKKVSDLELSI